MLIAVTDHAAERFRQRVRGSLDAKTEIVARVARAHAAGRVEAGQRGAVLVRDLDRRRRIRLRLPPGGRQRARGRNAVGGGRGRRCAPPLHRRAAPRRPPGPLRPHRLGAASGRELGSSNSPPSPSLAPRQLRHRSGRSSASAATSSSRRADLAGDPSRRRRLPWKKGSRSWTPPTSTAGYERGSTSARCSRVVATRSCWPRSSGWTWATGAVPGARAASTSWTPSTRR